MSKGPWSPPFLMIINDPCLSFGCLIIQDLPGDPIRVSIHRISRQVGGIPPVAIYPVPGTFAPIPYHIQSYGVAATNTGR